MNTNTDTNTTTATTTTTTDENHTTKVISNHSSTNANAKHMMNARCH